MVVLVQHFNSTLTHSFFIFAGGRDTAGLGGKGGPYRLDAGHKVYQVSQSEKDAVPEEVRRAAREMAEKAFKNRLVVLHAENKVITCERCLPSMGEP